MNPVDVVAMLAVLQYLVFASLVGKARGRYGVKVNLPRRNGRQEAIL